MSKLGKWADRVSSERAIGVEVVAARVGGEEQFKMYRLMMENVWAMVQEGFSEKVIEVGRPLRKTSSGGSGMSCGGG